MGIIKEDSLKATIAFEFEDILVYRKHALMGSESRTTYSVVREGDNLILGTLVKYSEGSTMMDVHFNKKYTSENKHASGWIKLEIRKPQKSKILISRMIDRSIRPLIKDEGVQIIITLVDSDKNSPLPMRGILLAASDLLFKTGIINSRILPYYKQWESNYFCATVYNHGITMVEASLNFMSFEDFREHLIKACELEFKDSIIDEKPKITEFDSRKSIALRELFQGIKRIFLEKKISESKSIIGDILAKYEEELRIFEIANKILSIFYNSYGRIDGRDKREIRKITFEEFCLKKPAASILVTRGGTKVLTSMVISDEPQQVDESLSEKYKEYFNVQYDMLGHSVGSIARLTSHNRREIGHGNLIYNAVKNTKISKEISTFIQNEVISCDGSSSMAGTIGTSLSLYLTEQANELVAGVTVGRLGSHLVSDISGVEDWLGNMDFKCTGNNRGITAAQLDVKDYLLKKEDINETIERLKESLEKVYDLILNKGSSMEKRSVSQSIYQENIKLKSENAKFVIGYQGFNVKRLQDCYEVKINLDKVTNKLKISGEKEKVKEAFSKIESLMLPPKNQHIYEAKILEKFNNNYLVQPYESKSGFLAVNEKTNLLSIGSNVKVSLKNIEENRIIFNLEED